MSVEALIEPALYILGSKPDDATRELKQIAEAFHQLCRFSDYNGLSILCSMQLYELIDKIPYAELDSARMAPTSDLINRILRFLDRHATARKSWEGLEVEIDRVEPHVIPAPPLYCESSLDMAWRDLLAQCTGGDPCPPMILVDGQRSFAPPKTELIEISHKSGLVAQSPAVYPLSPPPSSKFLGVKECDSLASRVPENPDEPDIDYEDSGHQPSKLIKRVLERTAQRADGLVIRMNTTRMLPTGDHCKIRAATRPEQLEWTISDGQQRYKGYFTTRSTNTAEQRVALAIVGAEYKRQVERARLAWRDS